MIDNFGYFEDLGLHSFRAPEIGDRDILHKAGPEDARIRFNFESAKTLVR
jgi:hypothetical protein